MNCDHRTSYQAVDALISWFNKTEWPLHVNETKIRERAQVTRDEAQPDCSIVSVERHRPMLGAQYIRGLPMSAIQTYFMRYAVPNDGGAVEVLEEIAGEIKVNEFALAEEATSGECLDLRLYRLKNESYRIVEAITNQDTEITTLDEALSFGEEIADQCCDASDFRIELDAKEVLSSGKMADLKQEINSCIQERIAALIHELWEDRHNAEGEDDD